MGKLTRTIKGIAKRFYNAFDDYWYYPVSPPAISGVDVSETTALKLPSVWACVRVISETVASLPLLTFERRADGGKERAVKHPLYNLLHLRPNYEMTSFVFKELMMANLLLWGNFYAQIERARNNVIMGLWPLRPDRMQVYRSDSGSLYYVYTPVHKGEHGAREDFQSVTYSPDDILHIPGLGFNGLVGYSVISMERDAVGLGMAAEEFANRFFGNDATPGMVLRHPQRLSGDAQKRLQSSWIEAHGGLENKWKPAILEEGMEIQTITMPLKDAQFMELRSFQLEEICRIFRVPPHLIQDLRRATYSNIEHQGIDFVVNTIRPWLVRIEQAIQTKLFANETYFCEHLVDALLRGDIQSRYAAYAVGRQWGWLSADDVRSLENMNPLEEDQGKIYLVPLNMVPADKVEDIADNQTNPSPKLLDNKQSIDSNQEEDNMSAEDRMELENLRKMVKELREKTVSQEAEISAIPGQLEEERKKDRAKIEELSLKIIEKDGLINNLNETKESQVASLNAIIIEREKRINGLNDQIGEMKNAFSRVFVDAIQRIVRREQIGIKRAIQKKDLAGFEAHIEEFYRDLPEFMSSTLHPCVTTYASFSNSTGALNFISDFIPNHINESRTELKKWIGIYLHDSTNGEIKRNDNAIEDCLNLWIKQRPEKAIGEFQTFFGSS